MLVPQFHPIEKTCCHMQKTNCSRGKKCLFREAIFYQMAWKKETFSSCPQMFCLVSHHTLFHSKKNSCLHNRHWRNWQGWSASVFLLSIAGYSSQKWYRYIFWFSFNLSVCNSFILDSIYHANQGDQKRDSWSTSGFIWHNNWSMVLPKARRIKDHRRL